MSKSLCSLFTISCDRKAKWNRLWYNGVPAIQFPQSVLRTSSSISSITGLFFSTFFGGDDTNWASPSQQFSYYKNIQLFGGKGISTASGPATTTSSAAAMGQKVNWNGVGSVVVGLGMAMVGAMSIALL